MFDGVANEGSPRYIETELPPDGAGGGGTDLACAGGGNV